MPVEAGTGTHDEPCAEAPLAEPLPDDAADVVPAEDAPPWLLERVPEDPDDATSLMAPLVEALVDEDDGPGPLAELATADVAPPDDVEDDAIWLVPAELLEDEPAPDEDDGPPCDDGPLDVAAPVPPSFFLLLQCPSWQLLSSTA